MGILRRHTVAGEGQKGGREREGRIALKLKGMATDPYRDVH